MNGLTKHQRNTIDIVLHQIVESRENRFPDNEVFEILYSSINFKLWQAKIPNVDEKTDSYEYF